MYLHRMIIANITISNNSIISSGGSIDFGNEQLSTTGGITSGGTLVSRFNNQCFNAI